MADGQVGRRGSPANKPAERNVNAERARANSRNRSSEDRIVPERTSKSLNAKVKNRFWKRKFDSNSSEL